ncbi:MAG: hypothetical protein SGILL_010629 [Bacillariaceae sp.]
MAPAPDKTVSLETSGDGGDGRVEPSRHHEQKEEPTPQQLQLQAPRPVADALERNSDNVVDITRIDPRAVDSMLANEIQQLSFQEREAVSEEIHGVRTLAPEETPEKIETSLRVMEQHIASISNKEAFEKAEINGSLYIQDREFRLKFLRANDFDAAKAAKKFIKYLDLLDKYYGVDALMRPLYFSDLREPELDLLRAGHMQLLGTRDRSGRRILNVLGAYRGEHTVFSKCTVGPMYIHYCTHTSSSYHAFETQIKLALYVYGLASNDEETKKSGLVLVISPTTDQQTVSDPEEHLEVAKFAQALPLRFAAIHFCLPNDGPAFHLLRATMVLIFATDQRIRVKFHTGLKLECRYKLLTFGIPVQDFPDNEDGMIDSVKFRSLVRTRTSVDNALKASGKFCLDDSHVECPRQKDILFSRGGSYFSHLGNVRFRHTLETKRELHQAGRTNEEKSRIVQEIVNSLQSDGFRFLTWDNSVGLWDNLTDSVVIRGKVASAMRDHCKRRKSARDQVLNNATSHFTGQDGRKRKKPDSWFCGKGFNSVDGTGRNI